MAVLHRMIGFVITSQPEKAKAFYGDVLGFRLMSDDNFALVFDANGTMIRVGKGEPHQITPLAEPAQWFNKHIEPRNRG